MSKFLIVGLGNVGDKYDNTRHNIGFDVLDVLAEKQEITFDLKRFGFRADFRFKGKSLHLLKPTTYMNLSGKAVRYWMQLLKIPVNNVLIVVDDKDLPFGKLRLKPRGNDGGHNGLKNITQLLGHNKYPRLRFGIGNDFPKGKQIQFVLGKWSPDEEAGLGQPIEKSCEMILSFATIGIERTMNTFN